MKKTLKLFLLTVFALLAISFLFSQPRAGATDLQRTVYADPKVKDAIEFLKNRLPQLIVEDRDRAIDEYLVHFDNLNKLDELDVLFLVGHFYAVVDDAKTAIPYFEILINDPRLGEDARRMLNLLLYQRAVAYLRGTDDKATQDFLEDVLNIFPTGRYYATYLYLWADLLSEGERHAEVKSFIQNYNANRDWIVNTFKPRKAQIIARINNLNLQRYYANPTNQEYLALETEINNIQKDLQTLYNEAKSVRGLVMMESIDKIQIEELAILDDLKKQIREYQKTPPVDLEAMASIETIGQIAVAYEDYREGAILLQELKGYSDYYAKVINIIDRIFEKQYQLFVEGDQSVIGRDFSDMEMKRLFDIEQTLYIYEEIIASIDEIMADPDYPSLRIDLRPERQEYQMKLADLQNRKERYIAMRKHQDEVEEEIFNAILEEYYAISRFKIMLDDTLPILEETMVSMIMEQYPEDMKQIIESQQILAADDTTRNIALDQNLDAVFTNIDFVQLQLDYRNLRYRDQQRLAVAANLSQEEQDRQYRMILADKAALLQRHQDFVARNPNFQALEQPSGGYLVSNADIYYNMAELQYAVDLERPELALAYYRRVLEMNPAFYLRDYVLYNIAYISSEMKKEELDVKIAEFRDLNPGVSRPDEYKHKESDYREALLAYNEITTNEKYRQSALYDEALFRLSVLNFIIGTDADEPIRYYQAANQGFDYLINKAGSKYAYEALYQRAWVNMNRGDDASLKYALNDFVTLLKAVDAGKIENRFLAEDYKNNSVDNIAYTLIALDGNDFTSPSRGIPEMQLVLADYQDQAVIGRILDKAASFKSEMEAPLQAIDFLELRIQKAPMALNNPALVDSILKLYHIPGIQLRGTDDLATIRARKYQFIIDNYNQSSNWYATNIQGKDINDPELKVQLDHIRNAYEELRIRKWNIMVTDASDQAYADYMQHMQNYSAFQEQFGAEFTQWRLEAEQSETVLSTILAEKRDTPEDYYTAIKMLRNYNDRYPDNPEFFDNEGRAYTYTQKMFDHLNTGFSQPGFVPAAGLPANQDSLFNYYSQASLRFYDVLNMPEYTSETNRMASAQILMSLADVELKQGRKEQAKSRYIKVLELEDRLDSETVRSIYINLATIAEEDRQYADAEQWYRRALPYALDTQDSEMINDQIKLQIQNNYELAEQRGDFALVASEFLRLAEEHKDEASKYTGYRYQAADAFKKAKMYQESIDLRLDIARTKTTTDEVYFLYWESWSIADSLMQNPTLAKQIKSDFIGLYPRSNRSFFLRVEEIEAMKNVPEQRDMAARMYLDLHNEVRANQIDSGEVSAEEIYLWAVDIYRQDNQVDKSLDLLTDFIQQYPGHGQTITFMTVLADGYLAKGDTLRFEQYAREIFQKDRNQPERYLRVANLKLGKIAFDFDSAYLNEDWTLAFAKRDEFKRVEAEYKREGLPMDNPLAYAAFEKAETEYAAIQAKIAYLREFDRQIQAVERGNFLNSTPAQLITVNPNTTWQRHLFGGSPNRIPGFKSTVEAEYNKVVRLLEQPGAVDLDNERRIKALDLICRINEYAADVIKTQVQRYLDIANEMAPYKDRSQFSQQQYTDLLDNQLWPYAYTFINPYIAYSYSIHMQIYTNFVLAGYTDANTQKTVNRLTEWNQMPQYQTTEFMLDSAWTMSMYQPGGISRNVTSGITTTTSPKGRRMSSLTIPPQQILSLERGFNARIAPDFVFLHIVHPYELDIYVNGQKIELIYVPVDTLIAGKPISTHYAARLPEEYWRAGPNTFKGEFRNEATEPVPFHFSMVAYYSQQRLADAIPPVTMKVNSDNTWKVITTNPETGESIANYAVIVQNFDLPIDKTDKLLNTAARAIWTTESPETPATEVVFEVDFNIDTQFREGYIDFVAPESASLYLNDAVLDEDYPMDYDAEPFLVYPNQVTIPGNLVKQGKNTLRMVVQNQSPHRGMIAEITIVKAGKE